MSLADRHPLPPDVRASLMQDPLPGPRSGRLLDARSIRETRPVRISRIAPDDPRPCRLAPLRAGLLVVAVACGNCSDPDLVSVPDQDQDSAIPCDDRCDDPSIQPHAPDRDRDGFGANDCDDSDPEVHPLAPERCNDRDDDCDGRTDEAEDLALAFCYSGPAATALVGTCRPGIVGCVGGVEVCTREVLPLPELCDGADNDCDGATDEGLGGPVDVALVVDLSGSMSSHLPGIQAQAATWPGLFGDDYRAALVLAPGAEDGIVTLALHLAPIPDWAAGVSSLGIQPVSYEPTLDALEKVACDSLVAWRPGSRRVVILATDEVGQTYAGGGDVEACATIPIWIYGSRENASGFRPLAAATGGAFRFLGALLSEAVPGC